MKLDEITHWPRHLWMASQSRMTSAWTLVESGDFAGAMYFGGLSVECVMQAIAIQEGKETDARHDLNLWLRKCPDLFVNAIKGPAGREHWSRLTADWDNRLRYLGTEGFLGYVRKRSMWNQLKGDEQARMKQFTKRFLHSAEEIKKKGDAQWLLLSNK